MNRLFVINSASSSGLSRSEFENLERYFLKSCGEFPYVLTKNAADIVFQTRKALHAGADQIIAVGGDGTVHGVINGFFESKVLINPEARLAISNTGTGSDYFRTLTENCGRTDWRKIVTQHVVREVDLGYISFEDEKLNQFYNNMASVGLSAEVLQIKERMAEWCPSQVKYILSTLMAMTRYKPISANIEINNQVIRVNLLGLFICKGIYAGGGMKFGTSVTLDDGYFSVVAIEQIHFLSFLKNISKLYNDRLDQLPEVHTYRTDKIDFRSDIPIGVELDGEIVGNICSFETSLVPRAIKLCFPDLNGGA